MKANILRDKTLEASDRLFESAALERACLAVMILAVLYFGAGFIRSGLFQELAAGLAG